jgi:hypothetical protein
MNQSRIRIAEMSDADGIRISVETRVEQRRSTLSFDQFALFPNVIAATLMAR